MTARVISVNVGRPMTQKVPRTRPTGIGKEPVGSIEVADPGPRRRQEDGSSPAGVSGDYIGDSKHHGGSDQAVYAFAREELDHWERELDRPIPPGLFGENLTTAGLDVDAAEVGDLWRVGEHVVLQVAGPRVPCATFAARMQERAWVRRFAEHGRGGAYLRVLKAGTIRPGDEVRVEPSGSGIDVPTTLRAFMGDPASAQVVLDADLYTGRHRTALVRAVGRASQDAGEDAAHDVVDSGGDSAGGSPGHSTGR